MAATAEPAPPAAIQRRDREVSLVRLYAMRAICLLFVVGNFDAVWQDLVDPDLTRRGMLDSMLNGLWVMALVALRYPLLMIPIFFFELVWKTLWFVSFGLRQWLDGMDTPQFREDLWSIGAMPIVFALLIPWPYVWRYYVRQPADRWR